MLVKLVFLAKFSGGKKCAAWFSLVRGNMVSCCGRTVLFVVAIANMAASQKKASTVACAIDPNRAPIPIIFIPVSSKHFYVCLAALSCGCFIARGLVRCSSQKRASDELAKKQSATARSNFGGVNFGDWIFDGSIKRQGHISSCVLI